MSPAQYGRAGATVAGALLLLGLIVLASVMVFQRYSSEHAEHAERDLMAVALSQAAQVEIVLRERHGDAELLAGLTPVWQAVGAGGPVPEATADILAAVRRTYGYSGVYLLDRDLRLLYRGTDDAPGSLEQAAMRRVIESRQAALVQVHAEGGAEASFGIIRPVFQDANSGLPLIGLVYIEIPVLRAIGHVVDRWPISNRSGDTVIARLDGGEIRYIIPPRELRGGDFGSVRPGGMTPELQRALQELHRTGSAIVTGPDVRGANVAAAMVAIAGSDWVLVAKEDIEEMQEGASRLATGIGAVALVMMLLIAGGSVLLHRTQVAERSAAEAALDARYRAATRSSLDGYVLFTLEGNIVDSNEAVQRMTGYRHDELEGKHVAELDSVAGRDEVERRIAALRDPEACAPAPAGAVPMVRRSMSTSAPATLPRPAVAPVMPLSAM
jgi:PAS domain-containing protein